MRTMRRQSWLSGPVDGVVFAVLMVAAAFLGRENPRFVYPQVLYGFLALLAFNLLNFSVLPRLLPEPRRAVLVAAYNILCLALVVRFSGGPQSYFWVLYLLPLFNACLAFRVRGVAAVAAAVVALLWASHAGAWTQARWAGLLEPLVKTAIICASAFVVLRVAAREREACGRLEGERRRGETERTRVQEQLRGMDRLATLGTLTAGVTHELNTPLSAILAWAHMRPGRDFGEEELPRVLERIEACAERCRRIMQDMLAFARQKTGGSRFCDLNALLRECLKIKEHDLLPDRVQAEADLAEDLPEVLTCPGEFQQVVFNLLTNAHQALRGAGRKDGRIRLSSRKEGGWVMVAVEDNGPGVPPELAERIWDSFFTTKAEGEGTGLGLAICRQIVMGQGGRIALEEAPGGGARFVVRLALPAAPAPVSPAPAPAVLQAAAAGRS
ncbi:MAG: GHKL domain-containing protein [Elusimicrobia bacterium]|nr:GHKL domain-containing protein [Elusimicrobiota bacterium]